MKHGEGMMLSHRAALEAILESYREELIRLCSRLVMADSQNPPGDTVKAATVCAEFLAGAPGVEVRIVEGKPTRANVVACVRGKRPGRRLILNGHLDTSPVPDPDRWTVPPFGGLVREGRIYGRGVADMKAGAAAQVATVAALAKLREQFAGELALTLVADEGAGAHWGTLFLLDNVPEASGDAMISGDVGSPLVARFGEKGFLWLKLAADGKPAGGAHAYLGENAVIRLIDGLRVVRELEAYPCPVPPAVAAAIDAAAPVSETLHGRGETHALKSVSVNVGTIEGGMKINAVPTRASASIDIRFPAGVTSSGLLNRINRGLNGISGVTVHVLDRAEPNWTDPGDEIVRLVRKNGKAVLGREPVASLRLGFSDARFYRQRGIPCVGYGATAYNGNAPDEYVEIADLIAVFRVHALTTYDFLGGSPDAVR